MENLQWCSGKIPEQFVWLVILVPQKNSMTSNRIGYHRDWCVIPINDFDGKSLCRQIELTVRCPISIITVISPAR
jgi:hypothetical protein